MLVEIQLEMLTPLWTGGVNPKSMNHVHETGIIGSMRWWYEAIVRGLGGHVCDPTDDNPEHRCQFDADAYQNQLKDGHSMEDALAAGLQNVCTVCRTFGCTGWKRRFEFSALAPTSQYRPLWMASLDHPNQFNHWWLSQVFDFQQPRLQVFFGKLSIQLQFSRGYEQQLSIIRALLSLMATYGAIGAKTQYGFGQFSYPEAYSAEESIRIIRRQIVSLPKPKSTSKEYYTVEDFWHLEFHIPEDNMMIRRFKQANAIGNEWQFQANVSHYLPVSFDIRYKLPGSDNLGLRQTYRLAYGKTVTRELFGTVPKNKEKEKRGSRIFVSHIFKKNRKDSNYILRVWGFTDPSITSTIKTAITSMFGNNLQLLETTSRDFLTLSGGTL